jgi:hypothetical protein
MGPRPKGCILGRKNITKWYTPENCHWTTSAEQSTTRSIRKNSKGFPGVWARGNRWRAKIGVGYSVINLGTFNTQLEAIDAYLGKYQELYGKVPEELLALKERLSWHLGL